MKHCKLCNKEFEPSKYTEKRQVYCSRECYKEATRIYMEKYNKQYQKLNEDKLKAYRQTEHYKTIKRKADKKYFQKNKHGSIKAYRQKPDVKKRKVISDKKYAQNNREKINAQSQEYWRKNKDKKAEIGKRYMQNIKQNNPERWKQIIAYGHNRHYSKGFIPIIDNPFPDDINVDYHHFIKGMPFCIPMPRQTHLYRGSGKKHWEHNDKWIEKLYCLNVDNLGLR